LITLGLLDFISQWVAGLISLVPPMPAQWATALSQINTGEAWLTNELGMLGSVVPWSLVTTCLIIWTGLVAYWMLMLSVRLLMWLANR
jgi:hypothetical protein